MDIMIENFIKESYTPMMIDEIIKSFDLFEKFELDSYDHEFLGLLPNQANLERFNTADSFLQILNDKLDYVLACVGFRLIADSSIKIKNSFLTAVHNLEYQSDYHVIIGLLDATVDPLEKISDILSNVCDLNSLDIFIHISKFNEDFLTTLRKFIDNKNLDIEDDQVDVINSLINYKAFRGFIDKLRPDLVYT